MSRRVHFIDWLRVLAVALLVPFHSARVFDVWDPFYAKSAVLSQSLSWMIVVIGIAHMPLLFLLAGASSYFALQKRHGRGYLGERAKRLLVPLLFGTLVIVPPQMWVGAMTNTGYEGSLVGWWPNFFTLRPGQPDYFGSFSPAHLWFILFLFVISAAALPVMALWRRRPDDGFARAASRRLARPEWWLVPPLVMLFAEGLPDIDGKNPFTYLVFFLLGYIAMADPSFTAEAERRRVPALAAAVAGTVTTLVVLPVTLAMPDPSFGRAAGTLLALTAGWVTILAALGWGKRLLDRPSAVLSYAAEASYPFYVLHQTVIVLLGFYLLKLSLGVWPTFLALVVAAFAVTLACYELVKRTRVTRFLFGMRPLPRPSAPGGSPEKAAA